MAVLEQIRDLVYIFAFSLMTYFYFRLAGRNLFAVVIRKNLQGVSAQEFVEPTNKWPAVMLGVLQPLLPSPTENINI